MFSIRFFLLLFFVLFSGHALAQKDFVRVEGSRFILNDKPFYFVGANLHIMHGPKARQHAEATIKAAAKDGMRVIRIWALGEGDSYASDWDKRYNFFRAGPKEWQKEAFKHLDHVLALAATYQLKVIITLSNRWSDYGGVAMYLRWLKIFDHGQFAYEDLFYQSQAAKKLYLDHLKRIVGRKNLKTNAFYKDDPTIMAWELQNEITGSMRGAKSRRAWVKLMAQEIRKLDSKHLISAGMIGYRLSKERDEWIKLCELPDVAFCDQHVYPEEHGLSRGRYLNGYIDDRIQLAHYVVKKPIIFGEFGFSDGSKRRAYHHAKLLKRFFYDGGNGALVWIYQPSLDWKRRYGILIDNATYKPLRKALSRIAKRVMRKIPRAKNGRLGEKWGKKNLAKTHITDYRYRGVHKKWQASKKENCKKLTINVDRYYRAHFEESGIWAGGKIVHAYGRRSGYFDYRFRLPKGPIKDLSLDIRLSSEYPGDTAPPDGFSTVDILVDGKKIKSMRIPPDDGEGKWFKVKVPQDVLAALKKKRVHTLKVLVPNNEKSEGVAIYGREAPMNRDPVEAIHPMSLEICH